ncbi:MAG: ZIP family metal transporter, partial [Sulfurimicrobium sp.]|nr:ZIP family metal transporter [Sulfurimicrobium sp.]
MSILAWIIASSLLGGALSVATAALFAFSARASMVPLLVSYAIGALLGAVFLEILPHAFELNH